MHLKALIRSHLPIAAFAIALAGSAAAQVSPDGFDWVTVGAVNNAPWTGLNDPLSPTYGRGSVAYQYKIGRTEVTTSQWVSFFNAAMARSDPLPLPRRWFAEPLWWGATVDPAYNGPGHRYKVRDDIPNAGMLPASGISWRTAAVLCNWLQNDKRTDRAAFLSGAYDTSTFAPDFAFPHFTDQPVHTPGARYWIPNLDEYMKAAHFDPNKNGLGQAGWWEYVNRSDVPPIYGPPPSFGGNGTGQANAGFELPGNAQLLIPLGAYPNMQSPWGLLDTAGGSDEWVEDTWVQGSTWYRVTEGTSRTLSITLSDAAWGWGSDIPSSEFQSHGLRLASEVPEPATILLVGCVLSTLMSRRRLR